MDEHLDEPPAEGPPAAAASEKADPPRPVRGLLWVVVPALVGAMAGAMWSAYYAASQRLDPATPVWVGGAIGLGVGAFIWVVFPYKGRPRPRSKAPQETPHD